MMKVLLKLFFHISKSYLRILHMYIIYLFISTSRSSLPPLPGISPCPASHFHLLPDPSPHLYTSPFPTSCSFCLSFCLSVCLSYFPVVSMFSWLAGWLLIQGGSPSFSSLSSLGSRFLLRFFLSFHQSHLSFFCLSIDCLALY